MQGRNIILVAIAVILGLVAVILANSYFTGVEERQAKVAREQKLTRIVVAAKELPFGTVLNEQNVRLTNWPENSVPVGAFTSIADATAGGNAALRTIVVGEPVLASKLSNRPTLSANLPEGQYAVAIPVSAVAAVGGFVRPGDLVDVLLTRQIPGGGADGNDRMTDVVLSSVPVLAIDVDANEQSTSPKVGKTATVQVDTLGAQKLALAQQLGVLSLALRNATDQTVTAASTVLPNQLTARNIRIAARTNSAPRTVPPMMTPPVSVAARKSGPMMTIVRGSEPSEYEVQRGY
jgi:pilus assembly protein CpaB